MTTTADAGDVLSPAALGPVDLATTAWPVRPAAARALSLRRSRLVAAIAEVHASNRTAATVTVDLLVLSAVALAVQVVPVWSAAPWALAIVVVGYLGDLYGDRDTIQTRGVLWYPGRTVLPVAIVAFCGQASGLMPEDAAIRLVPGAVLALCLVRLVTWLTLAVLRHRGIGMRRAIVLGSDPGAFTVARKLAEFPEGGLRPVAVVPIETLGFVREIDELVAEHAADHVVLAPAHSDDIDLVGHLQRARGVDARFSVVPPLGDLFLHPGRVSELGGMPFSPLGRVLRTRNRLPGKRSFDVVVASLLLLVVLPVLAVTALAVKLDDRGPVFFRQRRVGKGGATFHMLKFRSMVVGADTLRPQLQDHNFSDGLLFRMSGDPRITRVGRIIRRLSVDELPQLWNVVRGEMSLVGPRPLPVDPDAFSPGESERHTVLPGITGSWQISGGNGLAYQEMIRLDLAYIRNWTLWLDIRLLLRTVPALIHRHDPS
jgi:exopolysaccharide biosynthesis polyprenyl glycosylphosphotransferase